MSEAKTDRELLELAAKAAGYKLSWIDAYDAGLTDANYIPLKPELQHFVFSEWPHDRWNPLADDGDDARLEAELQFHVIWHPALDRVTVGLADRECLEPYGNDRQAARRRAGVRAAAAIGEAMK